MIHPTSWRSLSKSSSSCFFFCFLETFCFSWAGYCWFSLACFRSLNDVNVNTLKWIFRLLNILFLLDFLLLLRLRFATNIHLEDVVLRCRNSIIQMAWFVSCRVPSLVVFASFLIGGRSFLWRAPPQTCSASGSWVFCRRLWSSGTFSTQGGTPLFAPFALFALFVPLAQLRHLLPHPRYLPNLILPLGLKNWFTWYRLLLLLLRLLTHQKILIEFKFTLNTNKTTRAESFNVIRLWGGKLRMFKCILINKKKCEIFWESWTSSWSSEKDQSFHSHIEGSSRWYHKRNACCNIEIEGSWTIV